jgi:hypothetical protein
MKKNIVSMILAQLLIVSSAQAGMSLGGDLNTTTITPPTAPMSPGAPMQSSRVTHTPTQVIPATTSVNTGEDWKQTDLPPLYHFGALTGLGIVDSYGGLALLGTASITVLFLK